MLRDISRFLWMQTRCISVLIDPALRCGFQVLLFENCVIFIFYTFFFHKQSTFDPRPENCLSFLKNRPKKLFSNCLVDGLLTSIV